MMNKELVEITTKESVKSIQSFNP